MDRHARNDDASVQVLVAEVTGSDNIPSRLEAARFTSAAIDTPSGLWPQSGQVGVDHA